MMMFSNHKQSSVFNFSSAIETIPPGAQTTATSLTPTALADPWQQSHWAQTRSLSRITTSSDRSASLPADVADNTLATARNLGVVNGSLTVRDFVGNSDPSDFYRFQIAASSNLSLRLTGLSADADLYLIQDANHNGIVDRGEVLSYSIASGSNPEAIDLTGLAAGSYAIAVVQYQGDTNYLLRIRGTPGGAGGTLSTAANFGILTGQRSTSAFVSSTNPQAFYRFELNATSSLNLTLDGLSADADL